MAQADVRRRGVLAPLSYPVYRRLLISNALWWQTLAMWTVVAGSLVLDLTDSALAVSLLSFWRRTAQLSIGTFAGPISDRIGRRGTLVLTQLSVLGAMVAIFLLFFTQQLLAWQMTLAAFLIGAAWAVDLPARNGLVPDLVGRQGTVDAMILESFIQGIVGSIGALLAGWLLASLGPTGTFAVLIGLTAINVALLRHFSRAEIARTATVAGISLWQSISEGIHYVRHSSPILAVTLISAVLNTLIFPAMSLLPVFARDVLGRGPMGLGLLSAGYNIGTFVGLYVVSHLRRRITLGWLFIMGTLLQCGSLVIFALSQDFTISWLMIFCAGLGQAGFHTLRNVIILTTASEEMRGRAMSTVVLTQGVGLPGELQTGMLTESLGAPTTVAAQASIAAVISAAIALALPNLRRRSPKTETSPR